MNLNNGQDLLAGIQSWLAAAQSFPVATGLTVDQALDRARQLRSALREGRAVSPEGMVDGDILDTLHALLRILDRRGEPFDVKRLFLETVRTYDFIGQAQMPSDETAEREHLLAQTAYLAWRYSLRTRPFPECEEWQQRCLNHFSAAGVLPLVLQVPSAKRTTSVNRWFLSDPAAVVATCCWLRGLTDRSPRFAAAEAEALFGLISDGSLSALSYQESRLLLCELALVTGGCLRILGRLRRADEWLTKAEESFNGGPQAEALAARVAYIRMTLLHERREPEMVTELARDVIDRFEGLGMTRDAVKARFAEASAQKDAGRRDLAYSLMSALRVSREVEDWPSLNAAVVYSLAEMEAAYGRFEESEKRVSEALTLLSKTKEPWAVASFSAVIGEVRRRKGDLAGALAGYRTGIRLNLDAGIEVAAAYLRVLSSELLLEMNLETDAIDEIRQALPIIEREGVVRAGVAALGLLREAVRRQRLDPAAVRQLREVLQRGREGEGS